MRSEHNKRKTAAEKNAAMVAMGLSVSLYANIVIAAVVRKAQYL